MFRAWGFSSFFSYIFIAIICIISHNSYQLGFATACLFPKILFSLNNKICWIFTCNLAMQITSADNRILQEQLQDTVILVFLELCNFTCLPPPPSPRKEKKKTKEKKTLHIWTGAFYTLHFPLLLIYLSMKGICFSFTISVQKTRTWKRKLSAWSSNYLKSLVTVRHPLLKVVYLMYVLKSWERKFNHR